VKPYYQDNWVTIYNGDCREILPELPKVDLAITSPPFNLGNNHHTGNIKHNPYEDDLPEREYQEQQKEVLDLIYNTTSWCGSLFYQHKNRIKDGVSISPYNWIRRTDWLVKQEIVWFNRSQNFDKCRFYPMTERIYWLAKSNETVLSNTINKHDLWMIEPEGTDKQHTRAYPEKLVANILSCFPNAQSVLDPYLGSGTTCYSAKKFSIKSIGIEISEKYCEIAAKRCMQTVMNFAPPEKEVAQQARF